MMFSQMEHPIKLEMDDTYSQNVQWSFSYVGHLVKMANVIIVKWANLSTMFYNIPTYLPTNLSNFQVLPTYHPTIYLHNYLTLLLTHLPTYLPT